MLVFVDESGDTGMNLGQESSNSFTVALVVFEENEEAQAADERISLLRHELHKPMDFEFYLAHNSDDIRRRFFAAVIPYNFFYFGYIIDKTQLLKAGIEQKEAFYKYACGLLFESAKPYLEDGVVKFDASGSQEFQGDLARYLKHKINLPSAGRKRIRKVSLDESHRNNLLRLADKVCGALARSIRSDGAAAGRYRKMIKHREISVLTMLRLPSHKMCACPLGKCMCHARIHTSPF